MFDRSDAPGRISLKVSTQTHWCQYRINHHFSPLLLVLVREGKRWNYWQGLRRKENVTLDLFHNHKNQASVQRAGMSFYCFDYLDPDYLLTFNLLLVCFLLSRPETELCDNTRPAGPELPVSPQCYVTGESGKQSRQVTSRVSGDKRSCHPVFQRGNYQIIKAIS